MQLPPASIKLCIGTCRDFFKHSLPVILPSLYRAQFEPHEIVIINGGWEHPGRTKIQGSEMFFAQQNSIDFTALIEVVERNICSDYWFFLHDTCIAGPSFKHLIYDAPVKAPQKVAMRSHPSMNIGLYKMSYLLAYKDRLLQAKNLDHSSEALQHWKKWGVINEDYMLWKSPEPTYIYHQHLHPSDGYVLLPDQDVYNTGKPRRIEYFPQLDLTKAKSNWQGLTDKMVMAI